MKMWKHWFFTNSTKNGELTAQFSCPEITTICPTFFIVDLGFFKPSLLSVSLRGEGGRPDGSLRSFLGLPGNELPFASQTSLGSLVVLALLWPSQILPDSQLTDSSAHGLGFKSGRPNFPNVPSCVLLSLLFLLLGGRGVGGWSLFICPGSSTLFSVQ